MDWNAMAVVGWIARAHGNRGQVIINPETDFADTRFRPGSALFVNRSGVVTSLTVTSSRMQRERPIIALSGIDTMDAAEALAGLELRVPVATLATLPDGTYYHHDLIGCQVATRDGGEVGTVTGVEGTSGGSRLVVGAADGQEILIPLAQDICPLIDIAARRIVVDPPEGLLDVNRR